MPCYHPLLAANLGTDPETGKNRIKILPRRIGGHCNEVKDYRRMYGDSLLLLPCGHCLGCLKDYKAQWAVRILLEASLYEDNCFITLTYDDDHLPKDNKPHREEFVRFMKRLREKIGVPVRVFYCGEKGDESGRAHYHAILFGYQFPDLVSIGSTKKGSQIYKSEILESCWSFGISSVGTVDPGAAVYVAQYADKKKLSGIDDGSFIGMSRRPGLGCDRFNLRWFKSDTIYCALGSATIPRFFHKMLEGIDPKFYKEWKDARQKRCAQKIGTQFIHGLREEENYLYEENIQIENFVHKQRSSI